jgi:hypothetical protein
VEKASYYGSENHPVAIDGHMRSIGARPKYRIPAAYWLTGQDTDGIRARKADTQI